LLIKIAIFPIPRYEIIKKGKYVFLAVKTATKADRGQYVLVVHTKQGKNLVAYYILGIEGTSECIPTFYRTILLARGL